MRYTGNNCDGCKKPLLDDEDIVVCPECATPQHRECYNENGGCVNAHLHGTDFVWKGQVNTKKTIFSSTLIKDTEAEDIICPHCGEKNPAGSKECRNCSMKFTMFGVNIVEAAQREEQKMNKEKTPEEEISAPVKDIPEYDPPFEIGKGEGFPEKEEAEEGHAERPEGTNPWNLGGYDDYEEINTFKGPFPVEDYTSGVRTNTLGSFIRNNAQTYINKFKWSEIKGKNGFNWAAFLFSPYWFFYRKLYKPGIIFITMQLIMSMVTAPLLTPFSEFYEYLLTLDLETMSETMLYELSEQMVLIMNDLMLPMTIVALVTFSMHLISGFIANGMYKKYCIKMIHQGLAKKTVQEKISVFAKYGGGSFLLVFAAYFGEMLLSMLVSYLIY
ncbi:MAG: DUF2628 domain-containing protein [Clostridia bacterium]|nr:DUF2628 domain-containing protein [Clostridia bacterium]